MKYKLEKGHVYKCMCTKVYSCSEPRDDWGGGGGGGGGGGAGLSTLSWTVICFIFQQLVFRTLWLFRTAVKRTSCGVMKLLRTGWGPNSLTFIVVLTVSSIFTGRSSVLLYAHRDHKDYLGRGAEDDHLDFHTAPELWRVGSVSRDDLFLGKPPPPPPPQSLTSSGVASVDVKRSLFLQLQCSVCATCQ